MTILHISDTHGKHHQLRELPLADILVHSGDFTMAGSEEEAIDFLEWFIELPHRHKILVAGNHDDCLRGESIEGLPDNCHYLDCSGVTIHGITFYGIPLFMEDVKEGIMDIEELSCRLIQLLWNRYPQAIRDRYGIEPAEGTPGYEMLEMAGKKRGYLLARGEINTERMAKVLLDEYRSGKLGRFTLEVPVEEA